MTLHDSNTFFLMYFRKLSLLQRPINIIKNASVLSKNITIAAADLIECVPNFDSWDPNFFSSIVSATLWRHDKASFL